MMTLEERAKSYAMQVGDFRPNLCAADYIAGAKEERILLIEKACQWLENINTDDYMDSGVFQMHDMIRDFKKAMTR